MYRRGDPRWNRTFQHIADNFEHANESAQENLYSFTHRYVGPCLSSVNQCLNACTAPCFPAHNDRRRGRGRARGRAEQSFDFYDDWEDDENDGRLGWGSDNLERFLGSSNNYGATAQPGRQASMAYGQRSRDNRFNTGRRKSIAQPREGPDPTIIPSSSYFGFLGRLPFKFGSQVLRYKPSAADLTEHPGARRSLEEEQNQPLIEDSDEERHEQNEHKRHRRQRSHTNASGHTTDSLSSRGDIFPSEDELDDAVPLDDEFTAALERRTTGQWNDETSSSHARSGKSKRKSGSRVSSRNTHASGRKSMEEGNMRTSSSETIDEVPTLADLKLEEERLRIEEEAEVERKRQDAQQLARRRGLAPEGNLHLQIPSPSSNGPRSSSSHNVPTQMAAVGSSVSPLVRSPAIEIEGPSGAAPFPNFEPQTMPDSGSFHVDESDYSSIAPTPNKPLSINEQEQEVEDDSSFIPARLPHFDSRPD